MASGSRSILLGFYKVNIKLIYYFSSTLRLYERASGYINSIDRTRANAVS